MISVIVPIFNEEKNIVKFQSQFENIKGNYEVIFSDGGSSDKTLSLLKKQFRVINSPKGRAKQMNEAAKIAEGEILLFLHCDSIINPEVFTLIEKAVAKGCLYGCQKIRFDSENILMKICGVMSNARVVFRKIAFGDQGIFIEKKLFESMGGIPDIPIMEDYELSIRAKKRAVKLKLIDSIILTSSRRFIKNGILKTVFLMQKLQYLHRKGLDPHIIKDMYCDVR